MGDETNMNGIQVCVRVRPLNERERGSGFRNCVTFDDQTKQVVLMAVDKGTLMQLRGNSAKGYAFDRRYGPEHTSDNIYDDCVVHLVENLFKGYNATVLAYGQTGSGKTLTMSGGVGIHGMSESGIIKRAADHILANVSAVKQKLKPGEAISVKAYALELYNEELRDLSSHAAAAAAAAAASAGAEEGGTGSSSCVRLAERPCGNGRCVPEILGVETVEVEDAPGLIRFFSDCFENRATGATKMNDRSSRSHAIYTVLISRTLVDVSDGGDKVRTSVVESRFNLVDLAGSERVKRSGVTGAAFKEAVHINSGLLALGNVIVALAGDAGEPGDTGAAAAAGGVGPEGPASGRSSPVKAAKHIPYRDSKLTRLLQDSLGGNALTVLVSCISSCEADFEETNSTLKYANRACHIKNQPLPNKQLLLEEDLLPLLPANSSTGTMSITQMQLLLSEHARMKEVRERREAEKKEREEKRLAELRALKEAERKTPGFQRLRAAHYDDLRKKLISSHGNRALKDGVMDDSLMGFRKRDGEESPEPSESPSRSGPSYTRPTTASAAQGAGHRNRAGARPLTARTGSSHALSAVYGGSSGTRRAASTSSSPVPWEGGRGGVSPEILTLEQEHNTAPTDADGSRQETASVCSQQDEALQTDFAEIEEQQQGAQQPQQQQLSQDRDLQADMQSLTINKTGKELGQLVDEGTCMTPSSPNTIKAFYSEGEDTAAAPAAGAQQDGSSQCRSTANSNSAYQVLQFQPAQPDPEEPAGASAAQQQQPAPERVPAPQLLARFRVNQQDTLAVFKAVSVEDFGDVAGLLPPNTALPAADKMTYLLARLEVHPQAPEQLSQALESVAAGSSSMTEAVGPAVGCLMATFGTSLITDCIFDFEDPQELQDVGREQRLELWGLQIPHTSVRPALAAEPGGTTSSSCRRASAELQKQGGPSGAAVSAGGRPATSPQPATNTSSDNSSSITDPQQQQQQAEGVSCWSSADRLNVSIGLMYALCNLALEVGTAAGFCVPRPQLLKRWLQAGVRMKQVSGPAKLIYPTSAHDYSYYKSSTVAYFLVEEVKESLCRVLCPPSSSTAV